MSPENKLLEAFSDLKKVFIKVVLIQFSALFVALMVWGPSVDRGRTALWMYIYATASLLSLVTTARVVFLLVEMASAQDGGRPAGIVFWVLAKFFSFGVLATLIWFGGKFSTDFALLAGLTTFIVVPILGSFFWRERESRHASRA